MFDVGGPLGERVQELVGGAGDLGLAVDDRLPGDAEGVGELAAQHGLVEGAEHALVAFDVAGVEGQPAAVDSLHLRRDQRVGVELWVVGARGRLAERRHRQAAGVGVEAATVAADARRRAVALEVGERGAYRGVVGVEEAAVAGERPQHRDRLRGGERGVEAGAGRPGAAVGGVSVEQLATQRCPCLWVTAGEQLFELVDGDLSGEAQLVGLLAAPHAGASPGAAMRYLA